MDTGNAPLGERKQAEQAAGELLRQLNESTAWASEAMQRLNEQTAWASEAMQRLLDGLGERWCQLGADLEAREITAQLYLDNGRGSVRTLLRTLPNVAPLAVVKSVWGLCAEEARQRVFLSRGVMPVLWFSPLLEEEAATLAKGKAKGKPGPEEFSLRELLETWFEFHESGLPATKFLGFNPNAVWALRKAKPLARELGLKQRIRELEDMNLIPSLEERQRRKTPLTYATFTQLSETISRNFSK